MRALAEAPAPVIPDEPSVVHARSSLLLRKIFPADALGEDVFGGKRRAISKKSSSIVSGIERHRQKEPHLCAAPAGTAQRSVDKIVGVLEWRVANNGAKFRQLHPNVVGEEIRPREHNLMPELFE